MGRPYSPFCIEGTVGDADSRSDESYESCCHCGRCGGGSATQGLAGQRADGGTRGRGAVLHPELHEDLL
jgi:hypothetical protein